MTRPRSSYWKVQTKFVMIPAVIDSRRFDDDVAIRIHPSRRSCDKTCEPAMVILTPQEAQGFAAWLSDQAEHLLAKQRRAAARRAAKQESKK